MGCAHRVDLTGGGAYDYSFSYQYTINNVTYDTIVEHTGSGGARINYYSNPDVQYDGGDTGVDDSNDNARSIDELAVIIANYRADAPEILTVKDDNGDKVLAIDEQGHFVVEQNSTENASGGELTPTGGDILRIKDDSGSVLVRVDSGGDVYMDGIIDDWVTCPLTPANDLLTIKNDTETPIAFFDDAGSLDLTGRSLVWDGGF